MSARTYALLVWFLVFNWAVTAAPVADTGAPPQAWHDWALWVNRQQSAADDQGHGPDIGSDEWAGSINHRLQLGDKLPLRSPEWRAAVEKKLAARAAPPPPADDRQLLSSHDTLARFDGLSDHQCRGLTALCPDRCGESGKLATFTIVKYLAYQKPGEYGDPRQEKFMVLIEDNHQQPKVPAAIHKAIRALKPGDMVRLAWNHDYVTREGSKFPERPIRRVAVLTKEQAAALEAAGQPPPAEAP